MRVVSHTRAMNESIEQRVGRNVCVLREAQRLSKVEFCLMAGVSRPYLNKIEAGEANISIKQLDRLAKGLGVSPADLLK